MKWLDDRNATARKLALKRDDTQPYYKSFVDSDKACPHCDAWLRHTTRDGSNWSYDDLQCDCSFWKYELYPVGRYVRTKKGPDVEVETTKPV